MARLDAAGGMVVLVAGAGGGKSTLLDAWAAAGGAVPVDLAFEGLDAVPADGPVAVDNATASDVRALAARGGARGLAAGGDVRDLAAGGDARDLAAGGGVRGLAAGGGVRGLAAGGDERALVAGGGALGPIGRRGLVVAAEEEPGIAGLVLVAAGELAFAEDETYQVLAAAFGDAEAADVLAPDLHLLTNGWPGLVALAAAWLARQPAGERRERLVALARAEEGLAELLIPAVLAGLSEDEREVVRRAVYVPAVRESGAVPPFVQGLLRRPGWFVVPSGWKAALREHLPLSAAEIERLRSGYVAGM